MGLPFFGKKAREKRAQVAEVSASKLKLANTRFSEGLARFQEIRKEHRQIVKDNNDAFLKRVPEKINGSDRIFLPERTRDEIIKEKNARSRRLEGRSNLMTSRRARRIAKEEHWTARAEEILDGAKPGKHIILESKPRAGRTVGNTYEGKFISVDVKKGIIILEASNSKLFALNIDRVNRRTK